jgi:hypothetical protein
MTAREILIALFDQLIEGLSRFGCGMVGISYPDHFERDYHEDI